MEKALEHGFTDGAHDAWVELLLTWYYDPLYDYQLSAKRARVVVQGDTPTVLEHLKSCTRALQPVE